MIHEVIHRLNQKGYDVRDFNVRCVDGITYIEYVDGAPDWFVKDVLHGLNPVILRRVSDEVFMRLLQEIKTPSGINRVIHVKHKFKNMWFPVKSKVHTENIPPFP